ncbi:Os02g0478100 [Oryza sativa Japonica Group]|uniref:Os02g0478100 protein n=1 Tax=Oryza sativa subsp. japonica TaxID=39947 RepID=A0A0P0VJ02_ORYSJ|nr:Os02g0478100 [Oryza sativa Japonica Group]
MRMLRILDLEGTSGLKDRDLSQIGNFLHLRYLSLRGCADIYHLPNSLGNLWDIQVLDVSGTSIIKLPKTITKLKKLHYLRAGNIPKDDDTSSIELKESCDLSKMEHEPIDDLEIPDVEAKSTLGTSGLKDRDLSQIGNFLHLRYLSLRGCADIYHLPNSLGNLWDIQVLDVSGTSIIKLPKIITKLKKLHYLRAGNIPKDDATSSIELKESSDLSKMEHEPIDDLEIPDVEAKSVQFGMEVLDRTTSYCTITMQNTDYVKKRDIFHKYCKVLLPSILQELDMYGVKAPKGIGQLNDLHTLGVVNVVTGKVILRELEKLKKLHKLGLMGINKKNSQVVLSVIANLALLHSLSLQAEGEPGLQGCLDHTFAPLSKLQSLKIYGNLVTLPTWITQIQNLTKLKLRSTQLKLDLFLEVLGKLPHLAILRLWMNSFQSKELCFNFQQGTFLSLVVMELKDQGGLKSLTFMQGAMPRLELLQIDNCIHIDENGLSGVSSLPSLREVMLKGDHNEELMKNLCDQITLNQNQPVLKGA